jgi:hypothetical protein
MQAPAPPDDAEIAARAIRARTTRNRIVLGCFFASLVALGLLAMVWTFLFRADSDPAYIDRGPAR